MTCARNTGASACTCCERKGFCWGTCEDKPLPARVVYTFVNVHRTYTREQVEAYKALVDDIHTQTEDTQDD